MLTFAAPRAVSYWLGHDILDRAPRGDTFVARTIGVSLALAVLIPVLILLGVKAHSLWFVVPMVQCFWLVGVSAACFAVATRRRRKWPGTL